MATRTLLAVAAAAVACAQAAHAAAVACSSSNGPFCTAGVGGFGAPPAHALANLDRDSSAFRDAELLKRVKVENVLKQYELEAAQADDVVGEDQIREEIEILLDETAELISQLDLAGEEEGYVVGSFAFSSKGDTYELLETMKGKQLKEFFELAYEEVIQSWELTLEEMAPEIPQELRASIEQLKQLSDHSGFTFEHIDEFDRASIRHRFQHHRLIEIQRAFEQLIIARSPRDRHIALETVVFIFQLADELAPAPTEATPKKEQQVTPPEQQQQQQQEEEEEEEERAGGDDERVDPRSRL